MEKFKAPNPCLLFFIVVVSFTILTTPGKAETTTIHKEDTRNEGKNARLSGSLPGGTPINNVPFAKPVGNNGKQFQLGYQQQQDPNYPQQGINQPLTGFSPPFSATNQPYSGFNQPFSNTNQPFGGRNQAGSMDYAAFGNGGPTEMACIQGIALLCILTLMVCFGF